MGVGGFDVHSAFVFIGIIDIFFVIHLKEILFPAEDLSIALEPLNLPTKEFVFLPVNDNASKSRAGGTHW